MAKTEVRIVDEDEEDVKNPAKGGKDPDDDGFDDDGLPEFEIKMEKERSTWGDADDEDEDEDEKPRKKSKAKREEDDEDEDEIELRREELRRRLKANAAPKKEEKEEDEDEGGDSEEALTYKRAFVNSEMTAAEQAIRYLTDALTAAKENGESAKEVELQGKLDDAREKHRKFKGHADALSTAQPKKKAAPKKEAESTTKDTPEEAIDWLARNDWFVTPKTLKERGKRDAANEIYSKLEREGYRADTKLFYKELDARLRKETGDMDNDDEDEAPRQKKKAARSGGLPREGANGAKKGVVRVNIPPIMQKRAEDMHIDLSDPKVRKEYAKQIYLTEQAMKNGE